MAAEQRATRLVEAAAAAHFAVARILIEEYAAHIGAQLGVDWTMAYAK